MNSNAKPKELSTAEAELYDRQIRLWGIESQERLRAANVLIIGAKGLGSEVIKNIILSGINSLTILDDKIVTKKDLPTNFLLSPDSLGKTLAEGVLIRAQKLNPLVNLIPDVETFDKKDESYFKSFTIIAATGLNTNQMVFVDSLCRKHNIKFICGDVFGMFGFTMSDFMDHKYHVEQLIYGVRKRNFEGKSIPNTEHITVKKEDTEHFPSFEEALVQVEEEVKQAGGETKKRRNHLYYLLKAILCFRDETDREPSIETKDEDLEKLCEIRSHIIDTYKIPEDKLEIESLKLVFGEVAPVCSIVGGVFAQEIIKAVSCKEVPINNLFLFDPQTYSGNAEYLGLAANK